MNNYFACSCSHYNLIFYFCVSPYGSIIIAGYLAINTAALVASIEFGIQPLLFTAPDGTPLYCPYGLTIAIPAMMLAHLTVAGVVEGIVTAAALKFVTSQSSNMLLTPPESDKEV